MKADFIQYIGIWGNKKDGFEVDNSTILFENIDLPDTEDRTLIYKLRELGFLNDTADRRTIRVENYFPQLELVHKKTGLPIGHWYIKE